MTKRLIAAGIFFCAAYYTIVGALLYLAPSYFFQNIGPIGAFNPHYERDAGSFILPLGLALFFAVRDPYAFWPITTLAGVASLLHFGSHAIDGVRSFSQAATLAFFFAVAVILFVPAIAVAVNAKAKRNLARDA
jgi:hypothetical protein